MRLLLVDATLDLVAAAVEDEARLARLLEAHVAEGWPGFPEVLPHVREALARDGRSSAWGTVLFLLEAPRTLVGMGGYKGEPSDGLVEIGYAIAPAFQRRGLATEAARLLVRRAFADPRVGAVDAHTLPGPSASTRVLEKNGFARIGDMVDEEFGVVWRWRLARPARPPPGD